MTATRLSYAVSQRQRVCYVCVVRMVLLLCFLLVVLEQEVVVGVFLHVELSDAVVERALELVDGYVLACADKEAVAVHRGHPHASQLVEREVLARGGREVVVVLGSEGVGINLVEEHHLRLVGTAQVGQRLVNDVDLLLEVGVRDVHHVYEQVGLAHLVERALAYSSALAELSPFPL